MPLPIALAGLGAKALAALGGWGGIAAGAAGSLIPGIIDSLASSKTKEEAAAILAPARDAKIAELVGGGMRRDEATIKVDEQMQGEIQQKMQEGSLPAWAELGLGLVTGLGAAKLVGGMGKKAAGALPVKAEAGAVKPAAPAVVDDISSGATRSKEYFGSRGQKAELINPFDVRPMGYTGGVSPMGAEQLAALEARHAARQSPNSMRTVREPKRLGYDENADPKRQMELHGETPDMPVGSPLDDAEELAEWANRRGLMDRVSAGDSSRGLGYAEMEAARRAAIDEEKAAAFIGRELQMPFRRQRRE